MGFLKKKENEGSFDDQYNYDDSFMLPLDEENNITPWEKRSGNIHAPHALTKDELMMKPTVPRVKTDNGEITPAAKTLYEKMMTKKEQCEEKTEIIKKNTIEEIEMKPDLKTAEMKKKVEDATKSDAALQVESLLKKCQSYIDDDTVSVLDRHKPSPVYSLDSVDNIIGAAEKKAQERVAKIYNSQKQEDVAVGVSDIQMAPTEAVKRARQFKISDDSDSKSTARPIPVKIKVIEDNLPSEVLKKDSKINPSDISETQAEPLIKYATKTAPQSATKAEKPDDKDIEDLSATLIQPIDTPNLSGTVKSKYLNEKSALFDDFNKTFETAAIKTIRQKPHADVKFELDLPKDEQENDDSNNIRDYTCIDDAADINLELKSCRRRLLGRIFPTALITALLIALNLPFAAPVVANFSDIWGVIQLGVLVLAAIINLNTMKGIVGIFKATPDMDSMIACGTLAVFIQSALSVFLFSGAYNQLTAVACLALLFAGIGKLLIVSRIINGFKSIATTTKKSAIFIASDPISNAAMGRGGVLGDALVCVGKKTVNVSGFINNSYRPSPYERSMPKILIVSAAISLLGAIAGFAFTGGLPGAIMCFALCMMLGAPPTSLLLYNLPSKLASETLKDYNAALAGYDAGEEICECNAVACSSLDLFPDGTVKLYKMQLLSRNPVDQSLMDAAAVVSGARSPLTDIFRRILDKDMNKLPQVDAITYEEQMGLSGWIGERRILVGNRALMEGHAIKLPSKEVDNKILKNGFFPVYIACDNRPCVLLVVGYEPDSDIAFELQKLCNTGITLLVSSCDPNINEKMLCDYFELYNDSIKVMKAPGVNAYKQETNYAESTQGLGCFSDTICGFFAAVTASIRIKNISLVMLIMHIIGAVLGFAALGFALFTNQLSLITGTYVIIYELVITLLTAIIPYFKRP